MTELCLCGCTRIWHRDGSGRCEMSAGADVPGLRSPQHCTCRFYRHDPKGSAEFDAHLTEMASRRPETSEK